MLSLLRLPGIAGGHPRADPDGSQPRRRPRAPPAHPRRMDARPKQSTARSSAPPCSVRRNRRPVSRQPSAWPNSAAAPQRAARLQPPISWSNRVPDGCRR